jgi:hypothetical protein
MGKKSKSSSANGMAGSGLATAPRRSSSNGSSSVASKKPVGPETITLPNGQQIPVAPPPGVDPAMYGQALQYLRQNPEAALQAQEQARRMGNPLMAQAASAKLADPEYKKKMEELRADPDLKPVFDDIAATGAAGMEKYWNDGDLMTRISRKMAALGVSPEPQPQPPGKSIPARPSNLHDAAKAGDAAAVGALLEEGCAVDGRDARGITPLGVAVGFNRLPVVRALLAAGADVGLTDAKGNTALHYAAGYGRKEAAALLLDAGAVADAANSDGQTPVQVAETNRETHMVEYLTNRAAGSGKDGAELKTSDEIPDSEKYL